MTKPALRIGVTVRPGDRMPERIRIRKPLEGGRFVVPPGAWSHFEATRVVDVDFSGQKFTFLSAEQTVFESCNFSHTTYDGATSLGSRPGTVFVECRFDGADLRHWLLMGAARFERCSFEKSKIQGWRTNFGAEFVNNTFSGTLRTCIFYGRPVRPVLPNAPPWPDLGSETNAFQGNDFRRARLVDCEFRNGIDVGANLWPEGPEYLRLDRFTERVEGVRSAVATWPTPERRTAERTLQVLSTPGLMEQTTAFICLTEKDQSDPTLQRLWMLFKTVLELRSPPGSAASS